jgi:hypothetical protein
VPNTLRPSIERASLPLVTKLNGLPRVVPFLLLLALLVAGVVIAGPVGFILMALAPSSWGGSSICRGPA